MKNNFSKNLKHCRKENNLTQNELAKALGIHRSTLTAYEIGKRECDFDTLLELAEILGVTTDMLLK